jgi:transposase
MPWKNNSQQEQRWGFVQLAMRVKTGLAELCRRSGISRKTAYKWIARFKENGRRGLRDQGRSARRLYNQPKKKWLNRIRRGKGQHPSWGAPKIHWELKRRFGPIGLPSVAAIGRWLRTWGLTRRRPSSGPPCGKPGIPTMFGPSILRGIFARGMGPEWNP